ncbi:MAG: hypothetical protein P1V81_06890 [Planctomycetota bacterium]|nr:hypothetical protein [Planctomycetota bacterium]
MARYALALACLVTTPALAQKVWVVDDNAGPGIDFQDIGAAVGAASDGDTILVKAGSYADVVLNGRSLNIIAEAGPSPTVNGVSVRNVPVQGRVRLKGLSIQSSLEAGLQIKNNLGTVWVEDCQVHGAQGEGDFSSPDWHPDGSPGIQVVNAAALTIARCGVFGGDGDNYAPSASSYGAGGTAITVAGPSSVAVFDSDLFGGLGGSVNDDDAAWGGAPGGSCLVVADGELFAIGNDLFSGGGGGGGEDFDPFVGYSCGPGGDAGSGIVEGTPGGPPVLHLADNSFTSGVPGSPYSGGVCTIGAVGAALVAPTATLDMLNVDAFALFVTDPLREGQVATVTATGAPNSVVWLAISGAPTWLHLPTLGGLDLVDPLGMLLLPLGPTSGAGVVSQTFPAPALVPAGEAIELFTQLFALELGTGKLSLASPSGLTLLDASF